MVDPSYHEGAKNAIREHFVNVKGSPIRTPYYLSQLKVLFESDFFPWIVADALNDLVAEDYLETFINKDIPGADRLEYLPPIKFFANKDALVTDKDTRLMKRHMLSIAKLVSRYSAPDNSHTLGKQLESLVTYELRAQGFEIVKIHANELDGMKWTRTNENLDIIARKKDTGFTIGVEVKNTLGIIEPEEIDSKIDICNTLGITPVFACRWIKPYVNCIRRQGGFSWMFKTQIYPLGTEKFTKELYEKLSPRAMVNSQSGRGFPVSSNNNLPLKSISKFEEWVEANENNPPEIDTSIRCSTRPSNAYS